MEYELCTTYCNKPLINEAILSILRRRHILLYGVGGSVLGGMLGALALPVLGFGSAGVASGSIAAAWQSSIGIVPAGSAFALLQSLGATGMGTILFGAIGATGGGALGLMAHYSVGALTLPVLGFGSAGVASRSIAAAWQSSIGLVSAGSAFTLLQSLGASGMGTILFGAIGAATGGRALGLMHSVGANAVSIVPSSCPIAIKKILYL